MKISIETLKSFSLYSIIKLIISLYSVRQLTVDAAEAKAKFGGDDPITKAYEAKLVVPTGGMPQEDVQAITDALAGGMLPIDAMTALLAQCKAEDITPNVGDPREIAALNGADNMSQSEWRIEASLAAVKKCGSRTKKELEAVTGSTNLDKVIDKLVAVDGVSRNGDLFTWSVPAAPAATAA